MVNSSACPKTLLHIPLRALTAFGKPLFLLNTVETWRGSEVEKQKKAENLITRYCVEIHLLLELRVLCIP